MQTLGERAREVFCSYPVDSVSRPCSPVLSAAAALDEEHKKRRQRGPRQLSGRVSARGERERGGDDGPRDGSVDGAVGLQGIGARRLRSVHHARQALCPHRVAQRTGAAANVVQERERGERDGKGERGEREKKRRNNLLLFYVFLLSLSLFRFFRVICTHTHTHTHIRSRPHTCLLLWHCVVVCEDESAFPPTLARSSTVPLSLSLSLFLSSSSLGFSPLQ